LCEPFPMLLLLGGVLQVWMALGATIVLWIALVGVVGGDIGTRLSCIQSDTPYRSRWQPQCL